MRNIGSFRLTTVHGQCDMAIDKNHLYGRYQAHEDKQNTLALKMAHKALDIPEDMNVNATTNKTGIGSLGVAVVALAAGLPVAILAGVLLFKTPVASTHQDNSPVVAQPVGPQLQDKKLQRWNGKAWEDVDPVAIPSMPKSQQTP